MEYCCESKQYDEDDGCDLGWIVPIQDEGVRVVERRARLIFSHFDGWCSVQV